MSTFFALAIQKSQKNQAEIFRDHKKLAWMSDIRKIPLLSISLFPLRVDLRWWNHRCGEILQQTKLSPGYLNRTIRSKSQTDRTRHEGNAAAADIDEENIPLLDGTKEISQPHGIHQNGRTTQYSRKSRYQHVSLSTPLPPFEPA